MRACGCRDRDREYKDKTTNEIAALERGIKALDKSVAEATEVRKEEHIEFTSLTASDTAVKEILFLAKNRLNTFYIFGGDTVPPRAHWIDTGQNGLSDFHVSARCFETGQLKASTRRQESQSRSLRKNRRAEAGSDTL